MDYAAKTALMDQWDRLGGKLDGRLSAIAGLRLDFAIVHAIGTDTRAEFAWSTVQRAVASGKPSLRTK